MSSNLIDFHRRRQQAARQDAGFRNLITGAGTKRAYTEQFDWQPAPRIAKWQLDSMYEDHELVYKLVDFLPDDGMRKWIRYPKLDSKIADKVSKITKEANFRQALNEGLRMSRLHGGAAIYLDIDDGQNDDSPVDFKKIKSIEASVIESLYIWPESLKRSLRHTHYTMTQDTDKGSELIHKSRLIILQGCRVSRDSLIQNNGWSQSVVARCLAPLLAWGIAHGTIPQILKDFILDVIKFTGLNKMAMNDRPEDLKDFMDRIDAMSLAMSMLNKLVLDAGDSIERMTANVAGISDLLANADRRLVAASGMPYQKLFGMAQGNSLGANAGDSQDREWNKYVSAYQQDVILPALDRWHLYMAAMVQIDDICSQFCGLDELSTLDQATVLEKTSIAAKNLREAEVCSSAELAEMYSGEEIKPKPVLDFETREEIDLEELTEEQLLGPTHQPDAPPTGNVSSLGMDPEDPELDEPDETEAPTPAANGLPPRS